MHGIYDQFLPVVEMTTIPNLAHIRLFVFAQDMLGGSQFSTSRIPDYLKFCASRANCELWQCQGGDKDF
jgi:hypothetical protein